MGMAAQFRNMNDAFAVIASFPEYKNLPIIIGESDPEGCAACTGRTGRLSQRHDVFQLHRREFSARI